MRRFMSKLVSQLLFCCFMMWLLDYIIVICLYFQCIVLSVKLVLLFPTWMQHPGCLIPFVLSLRLKNGFRSTEESAPDNKEWWWALLNAVIGNMSLVFVCWGWSFIMVIDNRTGNVWVWLTEISSCCRIKSPCRYRIDISSRWTGLFAYEY